MKYHYYKKNKLSFFDWIEIFKALLKTDSAVYYQRTISIMTGATALYKKLFGKKMIFAIAHDNDVIKNFFRRSLKSIELNSLLKKIVKWFDYRFLNFWHAYGLKNADTIVAQTNFQKEELELNYGISSVLIRNSYDPSFREDKAEKENLVIWVGNMRKFKRAELFPDIVSRLNEPNWKFVMIGRTYPYVEDKINSFNRENFLHTGQLSYDEAEEYFKKAKILISTSTSEGFSNTFIHAWLHETLIVSLNVNPDSMFDNDNTGLCFNDDFDMMIDKMKELLSDFNSAMPVLDRAKKFVQNELDLKVNVDKLEELI